MRLGIMLSWSSSDASGASVTEADITIQVGDILSSSSSEYHILELLGEGCFGKVVKCQNVATSELVAVKILKDTEITQDIEQEVQILEEIRALDPDHTNMVKFFEQFQHVGFTCLAFEMLDTDLYCLLEEQNWKLLSLLEIQQVTKQLLVALDALRTAGILHTDIKPDNIMVVNRQEQPRRVKLIDFGLAMKASEVQLGMTIQPTGFRAPEVALGLPFTEAIDTWGVGCVLAFLYLADNLFHVGCDYLAMKTMVKVLGRPDDHLLSAGMYTKLFFTDLEAADGAVWRLTTPEEFKAATHKEPVEWDGFANMPSSLDEMVDMYPAKSAAPLEDRKTFVDLLKQMLHLDGDQRISPHRALQHPFVQQPVRATLDICESMMSFCTEDSADSEDTESDSDGSSTGSSDVHFLICCLDGDVDDWLSDDQQSFVSFDEDSDTRFSDRAQAEHLNGRESLSRKELSSSWDDGLWRSAADSTLQLCDGSRAVGCSDVNNPASAARSEKLLKRTRRLFRQMKDFFCCCCVPLQRTDYYHTPVNVLTITT